MASETIFITGAAAGIGKATAKLFHRRGYTVGLYDVDADGVAALERELGSRAVSGALDVTDSAAFDAAVADFAERFGRLDVLHNNAGILKMGAFEALTEQDHRRVFDVNVHGVMNGVRAALPHLRATAKTHGVARIINMCSASALYGVPGLASYSATKFAVRALTEALSIELEPDGIVVSSILPSFVDTGMVRDQADKVKIFQRLGIAHGPEDIAARIWDASQGSQLHYYGNRSLAVGDRLVHAAPKLTRLFFRRSARS